MSQGISGSGQHIIANPGFKKIAKDKKPRAIDWHRLFKRLEKATCVVACACIRREMDVGYKN
jgi:hypothetical protein